MSGNTIKDSVFQKELCVICQKRKLNSDEITDESGRKLLINIAAKKQDEVQERLSLLLPNGK